MNPPIEIKGIFRIKSKTAAQWMAADPILADGEPGRESDTKKIKYGDGRTTWKNLPYAGDNSVKNCRFITTATAGVDLQQSDEIIVVEGQKNMALPAAVNGKMLFIFKQDNTSTVINAAGTDKIQHGTTIGQSQSLAATGLIILIYEGSQKKWCMTVIPNPARY